MKQTALKCDRCGAESLYQRQDLPRLKDGDPEIINAFTCHACGLERRHYNTCIYRQYTYKKVNQ